MSTPSGVRATGPASFDELFSSNVLLVTGKGGVGKTTVAATLAQAAVASGRRTLLVEVEGRQSFKRVFNTQDWDYEEREFSPGLWGTSVDPAEAVYEYLEMYYGIKRVRMVMERMHAIDFVTTIAPGLRDLLLIGKVFEIEGRRREDGRRAYDTIILDAPPTGRILPFLQAPEAVTDVVRLGPIKRQSAMIDAMLGDPSRVQAILVTLLEEMPVTETIEGIDTLRKAGLRIGPIVANQVRSEMVTQADADRLDSLSPKGTKEVVKAVGGKLPVAAAELVVEAALAHRDRLALQSEMMADLEAVATAGLLELPLVTSPTFGAEELGALADVLALQVGESGPRAALVDWAPGESS